MLVCSAGSTLLALVNQFSFTQDSTDEQEIIHWIDNLFIAHSTLGMAIAKASGIKLEDMMKFTGKGGGKGSVMGTVLTGAKDRGNDQRKHGGYL